MLLLAGLALLGTLPLLAQDDDGAPPPPPPPDDSSVSDDGGAPDDNASFQTFYDSLANQGTWIQSSDYGYVWQPEVTDPDWAPYTEGHWVYTEDGWTWVSDEPWGWATYHYGRWVNLDGTGWCWVPGYTWAPAWVSWRYGDGYAGWAPLPPDSFVGVDYSDDGLAIGIGFHIGGDCDDFYGIGAGCYNFLPVECLGYRSYHGYYRHRGDNYGIINRTTNVTNINVTRNGANSGGRAHFGRVTTGGPMLTQVNAVAQTPIQRVNLVRASQPNGGGTLRANSLELYSPRVNPDTAAAPGRVAGSIGAANINRGTDIMRPLAVNTRLGGAPATEAQVQEARVAQDHVPASAKVMTDASSVRPVLQGPLTSMRPVAAPERAFDPSARETSNPGGAPGFPRGPSERTYPQAPGGGYVPSRTYYPNRVYSPGAPSEPYRTAPGGGGAHTYVRPSAPGGSYSPAPGASSGRSSEGGNGGSSTGGGHAAPSGGGGGGGGGSHSGGGSSSGR